MKCLILAGGSGDRLWPLSRKNYPKQFMEINNNRSLLQETVVRNLPFCDEFLISTHSAYNFIVRGQMKAFQGITYRCFLEEKSKGTAAAVALISMLSNPSELILTVSADTMTGNENYQEAIVSAKELAKQGKIVVFGTPYDKYMKSCGYIAHSGEDVAGFYTGMTEDELMKLSCDNDFLVHTGMSLFSAGSMVRTIKKSEPLLYEACVKLVKRIKKGMDTVVFPEELMKDMPALSLENAVFSRMPLKVVNSSFDWKNVDCYEDLAHSEKNVIKNNCKDTIIVNGTDNHLVVADGLSGLTIVQTKDVTFVGNGQTSDSVKQLIADYSESYSTYFNDHSCLYFPYGTQEVLVNQKGYKVKKTVIYPGYELRKHRHLNRTESWTITEGQADVIIGDKKISCGVGDTVNIGENVFHKVENTSDVSVTIIRTIIGNSDSKAETASETEAFSKGRIKSPNMVKLLPAFKDYLWGGNRIKNELNKKTDLEKVAESWELSAHEDGQSIIAEGPYKGLRFGKYLNLIGKEAWGWKAASMPRFPILIKFLDSDEPLSLQVHPDDEYALTHENEYGKFEMWYVLEAKEGAKIYQGFKREVSSDEIRKRVENGSLTGVLNERPVKPGDMVFIEPGLVHALGEGILVCEIQQNSNLTYRLYDYDRLDAYMNKRPLHIDKALAVVNTSSFVSENNKALSEKVYDGYKITELGSCKYFVSNLYDIDSEVNIKVDESSFISILVIDGEGELTDTKQTLKAKKGDSIFLKAGNYNVTIKGGLKCVVTHV